MPSSPTQATPDDLPLTLAGPPWRWIGAAIAVVCGLLYATLWRYGYHRDELYFRMLPTQWGYVDQPFMTPLLAKASIRVFGDTVFGLRALAPLCVAAGVVLTALTTRELGGSSRAQAFAAWGYGFAALPLLSGHLLETGTLDLTLWTAALLFVTRALLRDERWWLASGAVLGLAADNKLLVVILVLALTIGIGAIGPRPRSAGRSPYLWGGALVGLALASPSLIYQVSHHFPQVTMAQALHEHSATQIREQVVPFQVLLIGPPLFVLAVLGFIGLVRRPAWRPVRGLAPAYLVALLVNLLAGGQIYYAFGLLAFMVAAGWATERGPRWLLVAAVAVNAVFSVILALPLLPVSEVGFQAGLNSTIGDQVGWPTYVRTLRRVYEAMPVDDRSRAVILTGNYGEAGAVDRYGQGLPPVYSAQNELYFHGPPPATADVVLLWTQDYPAARTLFTDCRPATTMDDGVGLDNEEQGSVVAVCRVPPPGWAALWPRLQHFD